MRRFLQVVIVLAACSWVAGVVSAKHEAAHRQRLLAEAIPSRELLQELGSVATPENCPVKIVVLGSEAFRSSSGPSRFEIKGVEATNQSHIGLLSYQIDWVVYRSGEPAARLSAIYAEKPFGAIAPGESYSIDTLQLGVESEFGFTAVSGRLSSAEFADGTSCGLGEPPNIAYNVNHSSAF